MNNSHASLEDFTMLSVLGKGNFAKVLLARHNETQKTFAMKLIPKKNVSAKKQESLIKIERSVLAEVNHPFIIRMYYSFQNTKHLFFVLQYCPGGELYTQIFKKQRFSEENIKFYGAQMVLALEHLHSRNIVYRDLKPQNVLIDEKGYIRLTDFGLSDMQEDVITTRGTFMYLPPQVLNNSLSGKAVDWWGLGALLFEMLTGQPPFYDQQRSQISYKIRCSSPTFPKHISPQLRSLIQKLLTKNPDKRLGSKGAGQVKNHPWFKDMDWKRLFRKQLLPPYIPNISSDIDTSNFDSQYTECEVDSQVGSCRSIEEEFEHFHNFSFQNNFQIDMFDTLDLESSQEMEICLDIKIQTTSLVQSAN